MLAAPVISQSRALGIDTSNINSHIANKRLIIFELSGGNDGLNTLVPFKNPLYSNHRPNISLKSNEIIPITDYFALNNSLSGLAKSFENGEIAIIPDVGFAESDLSHFNCSDFWNSAGLEENGWIGKTISLNRETINRHKFDAHGIILGGSPLMMKGNSVEYLTVSGNRSISNSQYFDKPIKNNKSNAGVSHVASTINNYLAISSRIKKKLGKDNQFNSWFDYGDEFGAEIASLLWLIDSEVKSPVFKVSLSGFDMHKGLRGSHENILALVDRYLAALKRGLIEMGTWDDTVIIVYSEFGRRVAENASLGTDHGTSTPILLLGGKVSGGVFGEPANLDDLDKNGNTKFVTDFRQVYGSIISNFWQLNQNTFDQNKYKHLDIRFT